LCATNKTLISNLSDVTPTFGHIYLNSMPSHGRNWIKHGSLELTIPLCFSAMPLSSESAYLMSVSV
jgi:hypothetical protein